MAAHYQTQHILPIASFAQVNSDGIVLHAPNRYALAVHQVRLSLITNLDVGIVYAILKIVSFAPGLTHVVNAILGISTTPLLCSARQ